MVVDLRSIQAEINDPSLSILEKVGTGAFGTVYLAHDQELKRDVAIKLLHELYLEENDTNKSRFIQEARILASLDHRNLLKVYGLKLSEKSRPYIKSEFLEGESLAVYVANNAPIPLRTCLEISLQICEGMVYAESQKVVHRDLKPENIFLCRTGSDLTVKILDFGLCLDLGVDRQIRDFKTATGLLVGSPAFMSPEQCRGQKADHRSDIYSFACILYEMLTGKCLFSGANPAEVMVKQMQQIPDFIQSQFNKSELPESLSQLLLDCLEKEPRKRPQSFSMVHESLLELYQSNCTGIFKPELCTQEGVTQAPKNSKARIAITTILVLSVLIPVASVLLFLGSEQVRASQLRLLQILPMDQQLAIVQSGTDRLLSSGLYRQADDLCLSFLESDKFRKMPSQNRCLIASSLLQRIRNSCSNDTLERICLSLFKDIFGLYAYFPDIKVDEQSKKQIKELLQAPMEILISAVKSRKHEQAFWRNILKARSGLPTNKSNWIGGACVQVLELESLSLKNLHPRVSDDYEKLLKSLLSQADAYRTMYYDPKSVNKEFCLRKMEANTQEALSLIEELESSQSHIPAPRSLSRAKSHTLLYLALCASLRGKKDLATAYLKTARETDNNTGGGHKLLFQDVRTQLSWDELEEKIGSTEKSEVKGH